MSGSYWWYLFHKEVKSWDSATWFRIWQYFKSRLKSGIFKGISWLNGLFLGGMIGIFWKMESRPIKWHQCRLLTCLIVFYLHIYGLWKYRTWTVSRSSFGALTLSCIAIDFPVLISERKKERTLLRSHKMLSAEDNQTNAMLDVSVEASWSLSKCLICGERLWTRKDKARTCPAGPVLLLRRRPMNSCSLFLAQQPPPLSPLTPDNQTSNLYLRRSQREVMTCSPVLPLPLFPLPCNTCWPVLCRSPLTLVPFSGLVETSCFSSAIATTKTHYV